MIPREIEAAAKVVRAEHDTATPDDDGFVVCTCGVPFPAVEDWGDHYADQMLVAVVSTINGDLKHVVEFTETDWTMKHPLSCRAADLFKCPVNRAGQQQIEGPPPQGPGRYEVELVDSGVLRVIAPVVDP